MHKSVTSDIGGGGQLKRSLLSNSKLRGWNVNHFSFELCNFESFHIWNYTVPYNSIFGTICFHAIPCMEPYGYIPISHSSVRFHAWKWHETIVYMELQGSPMNLDPGPSDTFFELFFRISVNVNHFIEVFSFSFSYISCSRFCWDFTMLCLLITNMIVLPVAIAFFNEESSITWAIFNCLNDGLFITDIVLNFRTGIAHQHMAVQVILDPQKIKVNYLKGQ